MSTNSDGMMPGVLACMGQRMVCSAIRTQTPFNAAFLGAYTPPPRRHPLWEPVAVLPLSRLPQMPAKTLCVHAAVKCTQACTHTLALGTPHMQGSQTSFSPHHGWADVGDLTSVTC